MILNWEDDSEIYHDRKTKSENNGDEEVGLNENNETRGQKVFIPTHLSPVVRTKRFIFVFLFMFVDASLTIRNVSLGGYKILQIIIITLPDHCVNTFLALEPILLFFQVYKGNDKHVSRAAHAFGAATGLLVGFFILKNRTVSEGERKFQIGALVIFCIFVGILCIWHLAGGSGGEDSWFNKNLKRDFTDENVGSITLSVTEPKICPHLV